MDRSLSLSMAILVLLDSDVLVASKFYLEPSIRSRTPLCVDTFKNGTQTGQQSFSGLQDIFLSDSVCYLKGSNSTSHIALLSLSIKS